MQRNLRFWLFIGVFLLGAWVLMFSGPTHVSAASYDFIGDYQAGHSAGYNDCSNEVAYASNWWQSQAYKDGYAGGYQICQTSIQQGSIQGAGAGYKDGYQQCVTEHQAPPQIQSGVAFASMAPIETGIEKSYGPAWTQGYNDCEHAYGSK